MYVNMHLYEDLIRKYFPGKYMYVAIVLVKRRKYYKLGNKIY